MGHRRTEQESPSTRAFLRRTRPYWLPALAGVFVALVALLMYYRTDRLLRYDARFQLRPAEWGDSFSPDLVITGASRARAAEIRRVFQPDEGRSVYLVPLEERRSALVRQIPWVRQASVTRSWPNRIAVRITERTPAAFVHLAPARRGAPSPVKLIDEEGVLLDGAGSKPGELRVLTGISESHTRAERASRVGLMRRVLDEIGPAGKPVSEVDVSDPRNVQVVYPTPRRALTLILGGEQFRERFEKFLRHWPEVRQNMPNAISASIEAAVREAETRAKALVDSVVLGVGGGSIECDQGLGRCEFGRPREILPADLSFAVEKASRGRLADDRMLVHVFPQDFTVEGRAGYRYPVGLECSRLDANVLLVTMSEQEHQCLVHAAQQAHLAVEETMFEPVAAAYSAILQEERNRGAAVIDLGLHSTGIAIYDGDAAVGAASLPDSSDHFTRDLVYGLQYNHGITISYEDAEILKREYGCAMLGLTADNALVEVPSSDGRTSYEISRRQVNDILEARAEQLFLAVRDELVRAGMSQGLMEGVFLTGAGARLTGMLDMAERVLNCPAKYGLANDGIQDWPRNFQDPAWTTAAGLAMYSGRMHLQRKDGRNPPGLLGWLGM